MPRIDLQVPFDDIERSQAKRLGARWDPQGKVWFVPDGLDPGPFWRWMPCSPDIFLRSDSYFIAQTEHVCWKCHELTRVYCFVLPAGHEALIHKPLEAPSDKFHLPETMWIRISEPAIVNHVVTVTTAVADRIKAFAPRYRFDFSKTSRGLYWMNHCEHCEIIQGNFSLFDKPGSAFSPIDEQAASQIVLHTIGEQFGCNGVTSDDDCFFDSMRWA